MTDGTVAVNLCVVSLRIQGDDVGLTYPYTPTVLPQKMTVAAQIFQSERPARICSFWILSLFVTLP